MSLGERTERAEDLDKETRTDETNIYSKKNNNYKSSVNHILLDSAVHSSYTVIIMKTLRC